jgi:hypothetical protein
MKYELNPLVYGIGRLNCFSSTVSSAITWLSLIRIGYNATEEKVKAIGVKRTVAYACWLLGNFSDYCGDIAPDLFHKPHYFYYEILVSKERNYRIVAELFNFVSTWKLSMLWK